MLRTLRVTRRVSSEEDLFRLRENKGNKRLWTVKGRFSETRCTLQLEPGVYENMGMKCTDGGDEEQEVKMTQISGF